MNVLYAITIVYAIAWIGAFKQELVLQRADVVTGRIAGVSRLRALATAAAWPLLILGIVMMLVVEGVHDEF